MMNDILKKFHEVATCPRMQLEHYTSAGEKVILTSPVYLPEEIIHSMGMIPFGAWGGDLELSKSKEYYPAFVCSIAQSILELGMKGTYKGATAIVIPSLCDTLKTLGQNWKYAVPSIPFIPMTYPQNRNSDYGIAFTKSSYEYVIQELEKLGGRFSMESLAKSNNVYNEHNKVMRRLNEVLSIHSEITAVQRSDIFKSAYFMKKEEHTVWVKALINELEKRVRNCEKTPVVVSGIIADSQELNQIFDDNNLHIVADDIAAQSRQYRVDVPEGEDALISLAQKFANMDNCSVLYNYKKPRIQWIIDQAKEHKAKGVIMVQTKFCDPEEFDYVILKKACEKEDITLVTIELDRQMCKFEQIKTTIETFRDMLIL